MHPKLITASVKIMEAFKLIEGVKDPKFAQRKDDLLRIVQALAAKLLENDESITTKK